MVATENRERIIRAAWEERGKAQWDLNSHGRGLLSLHIPAKVEMRPARVGTPLPPYDDLEFRLVRATMSGLPIDSIVCEGVVVETIEGTTPPSTGWMNNSGDAANTVVQIAAANQRRNMAAISSQPTFVPPPLEAPHYLPEMEGSFRIGGGETLTVTFADNESVIGWLSGQSDDVAVMLAARAALRVIPTITFSSWASGSKSKARRDVVLRAFGAVAAAWAVSAYPGHRDLLNKAARSALFGLGNVRLPPPIRAAAYASATATGEAGAVSRASTVIGYALDAAASNGRRPFESLLAAFSADASLLNQGFSPVTLANSRLWPGAVPVWVANSWAELRAELLGLNEDWDVWTDWYDGFLSGNFPNQEVQIGRVTIENAIWQQGPGLLNAHIKEIITEHEIFRSASEDHPEELPNADTIPRQTTAGSQFVINAEGQLDLSLDAPLADVMQREIYQEVRHKALVLSALGHNQLAGMSEPVARFLAAAPDRIEDVSIARLWSRGNTLRRRLKAHDTAAALAEPTDPAILSASVGEMLRDLVESYNVFIVGDPSGRELDQVRLGPQERQRAELVVDLALPIAKAVQESEGVATAVATDALMEQIEAARDAPPGLDGEQAVDLSRKTTGNFVAELLRLAYARVRGEPGFAWKEIRAGTYRYTGPALIAGGYVSPIVAFVTAQASNLRLFVEQVFHNPTLVQIIDVVSKLGAPH
jgi:hypothetical protein